MYWVNTMVRKLCCIEPTPRVRALFQHILHCACSKTSIRINKYMQKAGELMRFLKHIYSQLKLQLFILVVTVFRLYIYGFSKWLLTQLTHAHTATVRSHVHSTCSARALVMHYLYCVYALVGGAISIRDPYICAVHESVAKNRTLSSTGPLSVQ